MTREEKIQKRKDRAHKRISKRMQERNVIRNTMNIHNISFRTARDKVRGKSVFVCEMGWRSCCERGYCNGDC